MKSNLYKFRLHWASAIMRGVEFKLTFHQWLKIWKDSGHFKERGIKSGCYVMGRKNDSGPYEVGNVYITLSAQNVKDGFVFRDAKREQIKKERWEKLLAEKKPEWQEAEKKRIEEYEKRKPHIKRMMELIRHEKAISTPFVRHFHSYSGKRF